MEELKRRFEEHLIEDRHMYEQIHTILRDIKEGQHLVNVNHLPHIEANMGTLATSLTDLRIAHTKTASDAEWTKKIMFMVLSAAVVGVAGLFFSLFGK